MPWRSNIPIAPRRSNAVVTSHVDETRRASVSSELYTEVHIDIAGVRSSWSANAKRPRRTILVVGRGTRTGTAEPGVAAQVRGVGLYTQL